MEQVYYYIDINEDDETGLIRNSFVKDPAVEITRYAFNEKDVKTLTFSEDSKQSFMSVSILADTPIPRGIDQNTGQPYSVIFTKDSIRRIVNKFVENGNINEVSFNHTDEIIEGVVLSEHFILEKGRVESPIFKDVPDGSWVTTYYVKDKDLYNKLKTDENFTGFSIEINAFIERAFSKVGLSIEEQIKSIVFSELTDNEKELKIKQLLEWKQ
jgi:hypothetical protein